MYSVVINNKTKGLKKTYFMHSDSLKTVVGIIRTLKWEKDCVDFIILDGIHGSGSVLFES